MHNILSLIELSVYGQENSNNWYNLLAKIDIGLLNFKAN